MKTFIKYLLFAILLVFSSCDERIVGLDNDELVTISEESLNYNLTGGHVSFANYSEKEITVLVGTTIEVVATPDEGYAFTGWYVGDSAEPVGVEPVFTFVVTKNTSLTAHFTKQSKISISSTGNGNVSFKDTSGTSRIALNGSEVTVVATPDEDSYFIGWFVGDGETPLSTDAEYTFTVKENITLTAKFSKCPVVAVLSMGGGSVSIKGANGTSKAFLPGSEVTVVATPDNGSVFRHWNLSGSAKPVSTDAEYTFIVNKDIALTAKFEFKTHDYVDLGLSVKWATCNVGASVPEEYGGYYAWGETEEKDSYDLSTYKWCNGSSTSMTKYCTSSNYGTVDNKTNLDPEDDVAHVKWGGTWRMPTLDEQKELLNNCTWNWTTQNGVNGYKVTGPNGNSIFLPAAGYRNGTETNRSDSYGYYWSSSLYSDNCSNAYYFYFSSNNHIRSYSSRYYGRTVRPVCK